MFWGAASVMCFLQSRRNFDCTQYRRVMKAHLINLFMVTRRLRVSSLTDAVFFAWQAKFVTPQAQILASALRFVDPRLP